MNGPVIIFSVGTGMDRHLATRVARRHGDLIRERTADDDVARDDEDEPLSTCPEGGTVSTEDVERLLGYAGVRVDRGSIEFDKEGFGEVEIQFRATRADGRPMSGVLVVYLRVDRDDGALRASVEIGPLW